MTEESMKKRSRFLEPEARCDYYIDANMKSVWKVQLDIVEEFIRICEAHNLKYFAIGGTLLGAIRHGGYIPWDDDVDFAMMRDQYDLFCKYAKRELRHPYVLQNFESDIYFNEGLSKIRNSETTQISTLAKEHRMRFNQGICIDIFPLDGIGDKNMLQWQKKWDDWFKWLRSVIRRPLRKTIYGSVKDIVCRVVYFFMGKKLCRMREDLFRRQSIKDSTRVGLIAFNMSKTNWQWDKSLFAKSIYVPYEYIDIPIPERYDEILRHQYGDWHKPVKGASSHSEIFFDVNKPYVEYLKEWGFI